MFSLLRGLKAGVKAFTMLDDADPGTVTDAEGGLSGYTDQTDGRYFSFTQFCHISLTVLMWPTDHYLYFRGIPNPPDAYIPPIGASVNTWPNIYNNLLDIDFCVVRCCSIDLFKTICKLRFCRITLIIWATA